MACGAGPGVGWGASSSTADDGGECDDTWSPGAHVFSSSGASGDGGECDDAVIGNDDRDQDGDDEDNQKAGDAATARARRCAGAAVGTEMWGYQ